MTSGWPAAIGILGAGRLGGSLAAALARAGYPVRAVASRAPASAARVAALAAGARVLDAAALAAACDLVFITTGDAAVPVVAATTPWRPGQTVAHCSGVLSLDALDPARDAGAAVASFYPMQTFAGEPAPADWEGITVALEGGDADRARLAGLAAALGARTLTLEPEQKALYHAAAVMLSNYTVALMSASARLWQALGFERTAAVAALLPLLRGTERNLARHGLPGALTGPIARGDVETIERHVRALDQWAPDLLPLYAVLARPAIALALEQGGLTPAAAAAIERTASTAQWARSTPEELP